MKKWYEFYSSDVAVEKLHQLGGELQRLGGELNIKLQQIGTEISESGLDTDFGLAFPFAFSFVPWRHHVEIITKCKDVDEAIFYLLETI